MGYKHNQFFSLTMYRELLKPVHARAIEWAHARGINAHLHSCGDMRPLVPELVEIGLDALNPLEVKAGMDPLALKAEYGDRLVLHGGINAVLWTKPEKIEAEMRRVVPALKEGGGYIFCSDHSVPSAVSLEDFRRIIELAKELGAYRIRAANHEEHEEHEEGRRARVGSREAGTNRRRGHGKAAGMVRMDATLGGPSGRGAHRRRSAGGGRRLACADAAGAHRTVKAAIEAYAPGLYGTTADVRVSGTLSGKDGKPLPADARVRLYTYAGYMTGAEATPLKDGAFAVRVRPGTVYVVATAEGMAPAFAGPFEAAPDHAPPAVELVLTRVTPPRSGSWAAGAGGRPAARSGPATCWMADGSFPSPSPSVPTGWWS